MIYFISQNKRLFDTSEIKRADVSDCLDYCNSISEVSTDTETEGFDPYTKRIISLQLGDQYNQFVIDISTISTLNFKNILENKLLLLQNAQFDLRFLYYQNIFPTKIYDTLLVEAIMTAGLGDKQDIDDITKDCGKKGIALDYADRRLALDDLALKYLNRVITKEIRGVIHREGLTDRVIKYAATDIEVLPLIKQRQLLEFDSFCTKYKTNYEILNLENEAVKVFSRMLHNGIKLDIDKYYKEVINIVEKQVEDSERKLDSIVESSKINKFSTYNPTSKKTKFFQVGFSRDLFDPVIKSNINWSSPEQKLGVLKQINPTLENSGNATLVNNKDKHPIFSTLIEYNKYKKLNDSFGKKLVDEVNSKTGKIHSQIWQILSTGRISVSNPNLNQIPSKGELGKIIRSCFIPQSEDYSIVGGDYSGMELAIIAEFSKDPLWVDTLKAGKNLHSVLCSETFDIPIDKVKEPFYANKDITYRDVQKTIDFG